MSMKLSNIVKEIIEQNSITKQTEITDILFKKYKINITQSNISRILKQIKAVKVPSVNKEMVYEIQEKLADTVNYIKKFVKKIDTNGYQIVINSYPGAGSLIAKTIDEKGIKNILGTIAGDNTVLIIPKDIKTIYELKKEIENIIG